MVFRVAQCGETPSLIRTGAGDLGLAIDRQGRLVLALGAVTEVALGADVQAANGFTNREHRQAYLEVAAGTDSRILRPGESTQIGGYDIYFERSGGQQ